MSIVSQIQIQTPCELQEWEPFIVGCFAKVKRPIRSMSPETIVEVLRCNCARPDVSLWVQQVDAQAKLFCLALARTGLFGDRSGFVHTLTAYPGAKTSFFVRTALIPWFKQFGLVQIFANSYSFGGPREQWFAKLGMFPLGTTYMGEIQYG